MPIHDWAKQFNLANNGDDVSLVHPNLYQPGVAITQVDRVQFTVLAPWPTWEGAPSNTQPDSPNRTGRSIELINPTMSDRGTNGSRWGWSTTQTSVEPSAYGTPGAQNSIYSSDSSVRDWSVY